MRWSRPPFGDFPALWFTGVTRSALERALEVESSVESYSLVTTQEDWLLYEFTGIVELCRLFDTVIENGAAVYDFTAAHGRWTLSLRFPERDGVCQTYEQLEKRGFTVTVGRLCDGGTESARAVGLTREQYETLTTAVEHGYFEIPREVTMEELADELEVSHQAVSERLRRAYKTLVASELGVDTGRDPVAESLPVA